MLINGIAQQLITGLPAFLGEKDIVPSRQEMLRVVEIPSCNGIIAFDDDVWDARDAFVMQRRSQNKIFFREFNPQFKDLLKAYAANEIDDGRKISTLHATIRLLGKTMNKATEFNARKTFRFIETLDVIRAIEELYANSDFDRSTAYILVNRFNRFLRDDAGVFLRIDEQILKRKKIALDKEIRAYRRHTPYPDIPDELFDALINMFDDVMRDENRTYNERMLAGMLLLNSQLGLRISEIPALEIDCRSSYLCSDGITRPYITYNSIKAARGDVESIPIDTFCNEIADKTLTYLLELRKSCVYANDTDFLLVLNPRGGKLDGVFPLDSNVFADLAKRLMGDNLREELRKDWPGIKRVKERGENGETLSIPSLHSFRKHFASTHSKAGTPLDYIDCAMSHTPQDDLWDSYGIGDTPPPVEERKRITDSVTQQKDLFDSHMMSIINSKEKE